MERELDQSVKSILEELNSVVLARDKTSVIESRASHVISSAVFLMELIEDTYGIEEATAINRRLLNSIKNKDTDKFIRSLRRVALDESKSKNK